MIITSVMAVRNVWTDMEAATKQRDVLQNELKPVILILHIIGVLPIQCTAGKFCFKILSPVMAYSVIVYITAIVCIWFTTFAQLSSLLNTYSYFDVLFFSLMAISYFLIIFVIPIINWPEGRHIAKYLQSWMIFQIEFHSVTGANISLSLRRKSLITSVIIFTLSFLFELLYQIIQDTSNVNIDWWIAIKEVYLDLVRFFIPFFWHLLCQAHSKASQQIEQHFQHDLLNSKSAWIVIAKYRKLWLEHGQLVHNIGESFCYTIGFYILYMFLTLTMFLYHTLCNMIRGFRGDMFLMCIECIVMGGVLFLICNDANCATSKTGDSFVAYLLQLRCSASKEIQTEVDIFLDTINRRYPSICLRNYVVVNRALFMSLGSMMVTYLIVLLQFNMTTDGKNTYNLIMEI